MVASCEEFFYIPGWPTGDRNDSLIGSATGFGMSTYYYSSHIDLRVDIGRTHQQSPKRASAAAGAAEIHLARADNFVGGFLGMMVRAEQQINMQHGELTSHSTSTSFIQGTLPNERMVELARERSLRLQRERELALPGRPQPPVLRTPKTSTPQLNPGKQRVGLTGTDRKTLFQSPESRQRNALSTAGRPAMQLSVDAWGNHENDENQVRTRRPIVFATTFCTASSNPSPYLPLFIELFRGVHDQMGVRGPYRGPQHSVRTAFSLRMCAGMYFMLLYWLCPLALYASL